MSTNPVDFETVLLADDSGGRDETDGEFQQESEALDRPGGS